jgi:transposase
MDGEQVNPECPVCRALQKRVAELEAKVDELMRIIEGLTRAGKRQSAPFSKGPPKVEPKKPGRKSGEDHGEHAERSVPPQIDEHYDAPLPGVCPHCGGESLSETGVASQYQTEIVRRAVHREFHVQIGCCDDCGHRVQGRHPLQTSDALGAARSQLGAEAHATMTWLNKSLGLSHGKVAKFFQQLFGMEVARATSIRSTQRTARRCGPAYEQIRQEIRGSPWVVPDETGWRVNGRSAWLHVHVGPRATCYAIDPHRDASVTEQLLGEHWSGVMIHDGWAPYAQFAAASHQQCLAHALRRARELLDVATRGARRFPRQVLALVQRALAWRDRYDSRGVSDTARQRAYERFTAELDSLVETRRTNAANQRFANHLAAHLHEWFFFLTRRGLDATNWRAEQAIRPAVVNRKVWGGNRTWLGARVQGTLTSILVTLNQRSQDLLTYLIATLQSQSPMPLPE